MTNTPRRSSVSKLREDDGVSAILVCLIVTFLIIPVAAVSVDLSSAYSNRRQMQNAADAAAQAGVQVMQQLKDQRSQSVTLSCAATNNASDCIDMTVQQVAADGGADTSSTDYYCHIGVVTYSSGTPTITGERSCANWDPTMTVPSSGLAYNVVKVRTWKRISTFFAGALPGGGVTSTNAIATAAAAVQPAGISTENLGAPLAVCGLDDKETPELLLSDGADPPKYSLNPAAIDNWSYTIWGNGNKIDFTCNAGTDFKGLVCDPTVDNNCDTSLVDGIFQLVSGAKVGPTIGAMAGETGCPPEDFGGGNTSFNPDDFTPCVVALPICEPAADGSGTTLLMCPAFGEFQLKAVTQGGGANVTSIVGEYVGPAQPAQAPPSCDLTTNPTCDVSADDARRIALVL